MASILEKIKSMLSGYTPTSGYGMREHPVDGGTKMHNGVDLVASGGKNAPIAAFVPGKVIYAGLGVDGSGYGNYGNTVAVKDAAGYTHVYGHLSKVSVKVGDSIGLGTIIGNQGTTGKSTGEHLHYEVRSGGFGTAVNPLQYLYQAAGGKGAGVEVVSANPNSNPANPTGEIYGPPISLKDKPAKSTRPGSAQFTLFGIIVFAAVLWLAAQSGSPDLKKTINGFLGVLLLSMILLNWEKIQPIFFKQ